MTKTIALIAATAATLIAAAVPASARAPGAYDPITLGQTGGADRYCIRTGWGIATTHANRRVRQGDCYDERGWRDRGIAIDAVDARMAARVTERSLAAR
ncbi:MAG: hypothetical protein FJ335_00065 [Sphingomonadales bacterium]|nr:hypothetical protein [Sphingomonadales bacterium]